MPHQKIENSEDKKSHLVRARELESKPGLLPPQELTAYLPLPTQAAHLQEARFLPAQKQHMAHQVGQVAGNRQLQRMLAPGGGSGMIIQRGVWDSIREWWSDLTSSDPEDVVQNLDSGLEHANTVLEAAVSTTTDPQRRRQLERMQNHISGLQRATGSIVQVLETAETIGKVEDFVEALNDIPDDITSDPERAADAFGRLFAAAGELGQLLPQGPWTMYFEFLSGMRDFFTNMRGALDPSVRWRRQFEEIEREAR